MRTALCVVVLASACVGPPPQPCTECGGSCVDVKTDRANCGECGKACAVGQLCTDGACRSNCPAGQLVCSGQCVDTQTDPRHCGGCGVPCAAGQACAQGLCGATCAPPNTVCGGACVNTQTDPANCGACGNGCDAGVCALGSCRLTCAPPLTECPGAVCADVRSDPNHCGSCAAVCSPGGVTGATCTLGECGYSSCAAGRSDCDGDRANGCEVTGPCVRSVLVSHTLDGGYPNGSSSSPQISSDGRWVVFLSAATDLVPGDPDNRENVFRWSRDTGAIDRLDLAPDGGFPGGAAAQPQLTPDGRFVCFGHTGELVDPPVKNGVGNVYRRDLQTGVTTLVNALDDGGFFTLAASDCQISDDGRLVAYITRQALDPVDTGGEVDVYLRDLQTGRNRIISVGTNGQVGTPQGFGFNAFNPTFSADFTKAAWSSAAGYPNDNNSCFDTWFRDLDAGVTAKVSVSGACVTSAASATPVQIFGAGNTVVMASTHAQLPGDTNGVGDVYFRSMTPIAAPVLRSDAHNYALGDGVASPRNVTRDGGFLCFTSAATNIGAARGSGAHLWVRDLATYVIVQVNLPEAVGANGVRGGSLADDGRAVTWDTGDTSAPGDTNGQYDVFWRQLR